MSMGMQSLESVLLVSLSGYVIGHDERRRVTRPICPAAVSFGIYFRGYEYRVWNQGDLKRLRDVDGDLRDVLWPYFENFKPRYVDELGCFEFSGIPAGGWDYVMKAFVEDKIYDHMSGPGNNGFGSVGVIRGADLRMNGGNAESIIIPVYDKWLPKVPKVDVNDRIEPPTIEEIAEMRKQMKEGQF